MLFLKNFLGPLIVASCFTAAGVAFTFYTDSVQKYAMEQSTRGYRRFNPLNWLIATRFYFYGLRFMGIVCFIAAVGAIVSLVQRNL